jgi:hypothetical protein
VPTKPTYPGVYIEEIDSGVRTITGVSTSITAFMGKANTGPIDRAVRVHSFAEYERRFGGLSLGDDHQPMEMGYAVRQFFLNGGSDAYVTRLVESADKAAIILNNDPPGGAAPVPVLTISALDAGFAGNNLEVRVDHPPNDENTFNLTVNYYAGPDRRPPTVSERFENVSMNSELNRFVETVVRDGSRLGSLPIECW